MQDVNDSLKAIRIPKGAHHLDLFFAHVNDPPSVRCCSIIEARDVKGRKRRHMSPMRKQLHVHMATACRQALGGLQAVAY